MGGLLLAMAAVAMFGAVWLLIQSLSWIHVLTAIAALGWVAFGLIYVGRSQAKVDVSADGLRQIGLGRWRLKWTEIRRVESGPSQVVVEPSAEALQRQSIRNAVQWSRFVAPGRERGVIVLPQSRIDSAAAQALQMHAAGDV